MIDEFTEHRFGYLRVLTTDEKLEKMKELEEDIESLTEIINDPLTTGEQKTEFRNDINYDREVISYLEAILKEPQL